MKFRDIFSMGVRNLFRRKTRTLLTVLGVVVGATAIIIMLSFGLGMNDKLDRMIASMGDLTVIELYTYVGKPVDGDQNNWQSFENKLNAELVEEIRKMDDVLAVTPYINIWGNMKVKAGKKYELRWVQLAGIDSSYLKYTGITLQSGVMPEPGDRGFIIFGNEVPTNFVDPRKRYKWQDFYNDDGTPKPPKIDIMSYDITLSIMGNGYWDSVNNVWVEGKIPRNGTYSFPTVGIMELNKQNYETSYMTYIDLTLAEEIQAAMEKLNKTPKTQSQIGKYERIKIKVKDLKSVEKVQADLEKLGITTYGLSDYREQMQSNQASTQMILGGIGAMSLIVAAIGIANTMFMSIYERTKEIGVMKVLGCPLGGIKTMFLFEASVIGFFGGLLGVAISLVASYAMNNVDFITKALSNFGGSGNYYYYGDMEPGAISIIPIWLVLLAVIFSTIIGLASGYLPARRATKISALEAIRNE